MTSQVHPSHWGYVMHWSGMMWVYRPDEYLFSVGPKKAGRTR
jgi:hypothetical protein